MYYNGKKLLSIDELNAFDSKAYAQEEKDKVMKIFVADILNDVEKILKSSWHNASKEPYSVVVSGSSWMGEAFNVVKELYKTEGIILEYDCLTSLFSFSIA